MNTVEKLEKYLTEELPGLNEYYESYREEWEGEPVNEFSVFAWIVDPYIDDLMKNGKEKELIRIWQALEHIVKNWGDPARNEIFLVTTEEMELHKHYQYLGPTLIELWTNFSEWPSTFNNNREP